MKLIFINFFFAFVYLKVEGLSYGESQHFKNTGTYGGKVSVQSQRDGTTVTISSNGLPDHPTQRVNPNTPTAQNYHYEFSTNPTEASTPGCVPMGIIGLTRTGVAIYNPLDAQGENAVEGSGSERFDSCDGHPDQHGVYHYHKIPDSCLYQGKEDEFIGVALDGFPIYGPRVSDLGRDITNKELDKCHGRMFNGTYRYHVNNEFPYFLGCFHGTVTSAHAAHRTQYTCNTDTSKYSAEWGYVCSCALPGQGGQMQHNPFQQQTFPNQQHNQFQPQMGFNQPQTQQPQMGTNQSQRPQMGTDQPQHFNPFQPQMGGQPPIDGHQYPLPHRPFDPNRPLLHHHPRPGDMFGRK